MDSMLSTVLMQAAEADDDFDTGLLITVLVVIVLILGIVYLVQRIR